MLDNIPNWLSDFLKSEEYKIASVGLYRLNHISESAELDIFQELMNEWMERTDGFGSKWAYLNFFLKILMAKWGGEVGWRSEV